MYLNVLEVHFRVLAEVDDGAEEVEESLVALEALEHLDKRRGCQLLVIFGCDLYDHLQE